MTMTFKEALNSKAEFNSLDELLDSEEFNVFMNGLHDPKNFPQKGDANTVEDTSGFPTPEREQL